MKFSKLLVMSALCLIGLNANAADLIERVKPTNADVPQVPVAFEADKEYLLYNTGADMYFSQGNSWGTKASGHANIEKANRLYFTPYVPSGGAWDGVTYIFKIYSSIRSDSYSWRECFFDSETAMFVDRGSQANYLWEIEEMGNNIYRLKAAQANPSIKSDGTQYVGRDDAVTQDNSNLDSHYDNANAYPLSPMLQEGDGVYIDWVFYDVSIFAQYDKSQELKAAIERAENAGIGVANAVAVYNDPTSTVEQMQEAIAALEEAMENNIINATGHTPQDASSWITNATFDTVGDFTGWKGTAFGAGGNVSTNAEHYGRNFDTYQEVSVPYAGLYAVGVGAFYRAGSVDEAYKHFTANDDDSRNVRLYATVDGETEETPVVSIYSGAPTSANKPDDTTDMINTNGYWIPNMMTSSNYCMNKLGLYKNYVFVEIPADATLRIGVKKETTISNDWSIFDNFSLTFFGNGDDRFYGWAKLFADAAPSFDGVTATQKYIDAYNEIKNNPNAVDKASAEAYIADLDSVKADLQENMKLWAQYTADVEAARELVKEYQNNLNNPYVGKLNGYVNQQINPMPGYFPNGSYSYIIARLSLDNEALNAEIEFLNQLKNDVLANADVSENTVMTSHLTNPDFHTNNWTGWTRVVKNAGNCAVSSECAEAWNTESFDIYQEVSNMPVGIYEISVQGFYRRNRGATAYNYYQANPEMEVPTYIYMNDNTTPFKNVFSEPATADLYSADESKGWSDLKGRCYVNGEEYYPDQMDSSARAFVYGNDGEGMYWNSAFGAIFSPDEVMRLGVKGSSNQDGDSWVIFDNFKLTYWATNVEKVAAALEAVMPEVKRLQEGRMSSTVRQEIADAIANAEAAEQAQDGAAMFAALKDLYSAKAKVMESKARMDNLAAVADTLNNMIADVPDTWSYLTQLTEAGELYESINTALDPSIGQGISDGEVDAKLDELHASMETVQSIIDLAAAYDELGEAIDGASDDVSEAWMLEANALKEEIEGKINNDKFDNGEFVVYKEKTEYMIATMNINRDDMAEATDAAPYDATNVIKTPNFEKVDEFDTEIVTNSIEGWKGTDGYNFGNDDKQKKALAVEFYHKAFDLHQELLGLPAGTYEVKADAFQRLDNATSQSALLYAQVKSELGEIDNHVMLKQLLDGGQVDSLTVEEEVEDPETGDMVMQPVLIGSQVKTVIDTATDEFLWVPNDMVSSAAYFKLATKPYQNSVIAQIEEGDTLRIGIKTEDANTWIIMDNFELWYYGANSSKQASGDTTVGINKLGGEKAVATVVRNEFFTVDGVRTMVLRKGIYVVRQTMSDGSVVVKKVTLK